MGKNDRALSSYLTDSEGSISPDRHPARSICNDKLMYDWIVNNGYNPIIIATKLDKLKRSQVQKNIKAIKDGLKLRPGSKIIPFSAETKQGKDEIWALMDELTGAVPAATDELKA